MPSLSPPRHSTSVQQLLQQALSMHRAGKFVDADTLYARILAIDADHGEALRLRGALHLACGQTESAIALLRHAVAVAPASPEAHYGLGNALAARGQHPGAIDAYRAAISFRKSFGEAWCNLGNVLAACQQWADAADAFQHAVTLTPKSATLQNNLGVALRKLGRHEAAIAAARRAIALDPRYVDALNNLGVAYKEAGKIDEAITTYEKALVLDPKCFDAHFNLSLAFGVAQRFPDEEKSFRDALRLKPDSAPALFGLGNALQDQKRWDEATEAYRSCLAFDPNHSDARCNLAGSLQKAGHLDAAIEVYKEYVKRTPPSADTLLSFSACLLDAKRWAEAGPHVESLVQQFPTIAGSWVNFGVYHFSVGQYATAESALHRAIELKPDLSEAYGNLGAVLRATGRFDEAMASFSRAIELAPNASHSSRLNFGFGELLRGNFEAGWPLHELRLSMPLSHFDKALARHVRWHADMPLDGKTICVPVEQGLGDTLQFMRYVPQLSARGAKVAFAVQSPLKKLLTGFPGAHAIFVEGDPIPPIDYQCPLLSLPFEFKTTFQSIPPVVQIAPDPAKVAAWSGRLTQGTAKKRIGVVWSGNPKHENDLNRSISLATFAELFTALPDIQFYSLQKNPSPADAAKLPAYPNVTNLGPEFGDFTDTAAAIAGLDLVISVDTSVAHLTGTMNKPVWILLPLSPDWRWLLGRDDSPWYPSARLFRQQTLGDWQAVIKRVAQELA